jgi:CheY-like chemotaxis protein
VTSIDGALVGALPHVVIADDEVHILDLVTDVVEALGCSVIRASNGEIALRAVLEHRPALVLTDVMMPRMRGDELCRRLKQTQDTANIPVVLLTSLPRGNVEAECAAAFIAKPFEIEQIESVVHDLLGSIQT